MKLLLVHLSDIHFTSDDDAITNKYHYIVDAVKNIDYSLSVCVVVVTGDIAFSGTDVVLTPKVGPAGVLVLWDDYTCEGRIIP